MTARHVVIMAGGSGTRFWPESRARFPKQFLNIGGGAPLLRATVDRLGEVVPPERLWVVAGEAHRPHVRELLPELPAANLLIEPVARNTAPCIAWATAIILQTEPNARIAVLPADHHVGEPESFRSDLEAAFEAAADHIVLFGIVPDRAETGYGYIQRGQRVAGTDDRPIHAVERFVEKPDAETAERYLAAGDYLWNSGMFVFAGRRMLEEVASLMPDLAAGVRAIVSGGRLEREYPKLPSISIDYGVMERSAMTRVIPSRFGWSDVGSWDAAMEIHPRDDRGNVIRGDVTVVDVTGSLIKAEAGRKVAVVGLDDVIVVDTPDALLVVRRGRSQSVKRVVEILRSGGELDLL